MTTPQSTVGACFVEGYNEELFAAYLGYENNI